MKTQWLSAALATTLAVGFGLYVPSTAQAGELQASHVPADAKWVLHIDYEAMSDTELMARVRESRPQIIERVREWFRSRYGIDPSDDLKGATMFGRDYQPHQGTIILQTDYDRDKVEADLRKNDSLQTTTWNDHTLFTLTVADRRGEASSRGNAATQNPAREDHTEEPSRTEEQARERQDRPGQPQQSGSERDLGTRRASDQPSAANRSSGRESGGRPMTVVLLDQTVVFATTPENAQQALRLIDGDAESLQGKDSPLVADVPSGAVIHGAAVDLEQIREHVVPFPVLQQHRQVTWVFGDQDGRLFEKAELVAASEEVAQKMEQVVRGVVAYQTLRAKDDKATRSLIDDVKIEREGSTLSIAWEGDTETVLAALGEWRQDAQQWMKMLVR